MVRVYKSIVVLAFSTTLVLLLSVPAYAALSGSTVNTVVWPAPGATGRNYCAEYQASIDTSNGWSYLRPLQQLPAYGGEPCDQMGSVPATPNQLSTRIKFYDGYTLCSFTNTISNSQYTSRWYVSAPSQPTVCAPGYYHVQDHPWYYNAQPATYLNSGNIYLPNQGGKLKYILKKYWAIILAIIVLIVIPTGVATASQIPNKPSVPTEVQMYDTVTHKSVAVSASKIRALRSQTGPPKTYWLANGAIHSASLKDTVTYNESTKTEIDTLTK